MKPNEEEDVDLKRIESELSFFDSFPDDDRLIAYLYKKSASSWESVTRYDGFVPDAFDVGSQYGAGKYRLVVKIDGEPVENGNGSKVFVCSEEYGQPKKREEQEPQPATLQGFDMNSILLAGAKMFTPLIPSIVGLLKPKPPVPISEQMQDIMATANNIVSESMTQNQKVFSTALKGVTTEITKSIGALVEAGLSSGQEYDDDDDDETEHGEVQTMRSPLVGMAWGMVEPMLAGFISNPDSEVLSGLKKNPLFNMVISNPPVVAELLGMVEEKLGSEACETIKKQLLKVQ